MELVREVSTESLAHEKAMEDSPLLQDSPLVSFHNAGKKDQRKIPTGLKASIHQKSDPTPATLPAHMFLLSRLRALMQRKLSAHTLLSTIQSSTLSKTYNFQKVADIYLPIQSELFHLV